MITTRTSTFKTWPTTFGLKSSCCGEVRAQAKRLGKYLPDNWGKQQITPCQVLWQMSCCELTHSHTRTHTHTKPPHKGPLPCTLGIESKYECISLDKRSAEIRLHKHHPATHCSEEDRQTDLQQQTTVKQKWGQRCKQRQQNLTHSWQPHYEHAHLHINYLCCCCLCVNAFVCYLSAIHCTAKRMYARYQQMPSGEVKKKINMSSWSKGWTSRGMTCDCIVAFGDALQSTFGTRHNM